MFDLTPAERRGALVLLALVAIGTLSDLLWREPRPAPAPLPPAAESGPSAQPPAGVGALDLNRAGEAELDRLPGIGPVLASRIVAHRKLHGPFRSPDDLLAVPGIGPKLLERLGASVIVSVPRAAAGDSVRFARSPRR
ncbi:MAG: helix-hairpin-helix domain-containing protein [Candidatus Eisenbacteria bacterium]|nr:helix-hairpin-helix domain-containing protein [Candidatus Eisenbacteria bacterium]